MIRRARGIAGQLITMRTSQRRTCSPIQTTAQKPLNKENGILTFGCLELLVRPEHQVNNCAEEIWQIDVVIGPRFGNSDKLAHGQQKSVIIASSYPHTGQIPKVIELPELLSSPCPAAARADDRIVHISSGFLEPAAGLEPAQPGWKPGALPLSYTGK